MHTGESRPLLKVFMNEISLSFQKTFYTMIIPSYILLRLIDVLRSRVTVLIQELHLCAINFAFLLIVKTFFFLGPDSI